MRECRAALLAISLLRGWVILVPFYYREQTTNASTLTDTLSFKSTFNFLANMASRRATETGIPNPTSEQPKRVEPVHSITFRWREAA